VGSKRAAGVALRGRKLGAEEKAAANRPQASARLNYRGS